MKKKMMAPIVIGIIIAIYLLFWISAVFMGLFAYGASKILIILAGLPLIALLFLWIHVVQERLKEIRSGEEDDLSKY